MSHIKKTDLTITANMGDYLIDYKVGETLFFITIDNVNNTPVIRLKKGVLTSFTLAQLEASDATDLDLRGEALFNGYPNHVPLIHIRRTKAEIEVYAASYLDENFEDLTAI